MNILTENNLDRSTISDIYPARKQLTPKQRKFHEKQPVQSSKWDIPEDNDENEDPVEREGGGKKRQRTATTGGKLRAACRPPQQTNCLSARDPDPKDFSQLFNNIRQSSSQREVRQDIVTFEDIAAKQAPQAAPTKQYGSQLAAMFRQEVSKLAESSRSELPPRPPVNRQPKTLHGLSEPPADRTLKTALRFSSPLPFECCQSAMTANSSSVTAVMEGFCCSREPTANSLQEQWQESLLSWQFPDFPLPAATIERMMKEKDDSLMFNRRHSWQSAFKSLYYLTRHNHCPAFYLVTAEGSKHPMVVMFCAGGTGGQSKVQALLSRSTRGMRALLQDPSCSIRFSMPHAPSYKPPQATDRHRKELNDLGPVASISGASGLDGSAQSLLRFRGARSVHGIYNWLLDTGLQNGSEAADVPRLLAPIPFLGASLTRHSFKIMPLAANAEQARGRTYRMEIRGLIPPWNVSKMCRVINASQSGDFQVVYEAEPLSTSLNVHSPSQPTEESRASGREDTSGLARSIGQTMHCSYLKELRCSSGIFDAKIAPA